MSRLMTLGAGLSGQPPESGGGTSPINPGSLANLELWLDSSVGITLNGSDVSAWADQSGNGNNATQGTAANQPAFNATGLNGHPTVEFDGVDEYLACDGPVAAFVGEDLPHTFFVVQEAGPSVSSGNWLSLEITGSSILNEVNWGVQTTPRVIARVRDSSSSSLTVSATEDVSQEEIYVAAYSGTSMTLYRQNTAIGGPTAANRGTVTPTIGRIAGSKIGEAGVTWFTGEISEIILYTRELSQSEREGVVQYLKEKYGL